MIVMKDTEINLEGKDFREEVTATFVLSFKQMRAAEHLLMNTVDNIPQPSYLRIVLPVSTSSSDVTSSTREFEKLWRYLAPELSWSVLSCARAREREKVEWFSHLSTSVLENTKPVLLFHQSN